MSMHQMVGISAQSNFIKLYAGSTLFNQFNSVSIDSSGNLFVAGYYNVGSTTKGVVLKLDRSGSRIQWQKDYQRTLVTSNIPDMQSIAVDSQDAVHVVGYMSTDTGNQSTLIQRLDNATGAFSGTGFYKQTCNNNISGGYLHRVAVGVGTSAHVCIDDATNSDAHIMKFNAAATSTTLSIRFSNSAGNGAPYAIDVDSSGNIYTVGYDDFNSSPQLFQGVYHKHNSAGGVQFTRRIGSTNETICTEVKVGSANTVYVAGNYGASPASNVFLASVQVGTGVTNWVRTLDDTKELYPARVCVDSDNNVYVVGRNFFATRNSFIAKYNSAGTIQWQREISSIGYTLSGGVGANSAQDFAINDAIVDENDLVLVGYAMSSDGSTQRGFLMRYPTSGSKLFSISNDDTTVDPSYAETTTIAASSYTTGTQSSIAGFTTSVTGFTGTTLTVVVSAATSMTQSNSSVNTVDKRIFF